MVEKKIGGDMTETTGIEIDDYLYFCRKYAGYLSRGDGNTDAGKKCLKQKNLMEGAIEIHGLAGYINQIRHEKHKVYKKL